MDESIDRQELQELWSSLRTDALRRGADEHTAEDVVQETWLRALQRPPRDRGRFRGWLHVVARRYLRELRSADTSRATRERWSARTEPTSLEPVSDPSLLYRYLEELPEPYRVVLQLRFFEGHEVQEIARILRRPQETVRSQLKRGLERLRVRMGDGRDERFGSVWGLAWLGTLLSGWRTHGGSARRVVGLSTFGVAALLVGWILWTDPGARSVRPGADLAVAAMDRDGGSARFSAPSRDPVLSGDPPPVELRPSREMLSVSGVVRTPDREPVPGAIVRAGSASSPANVRSVVADPDGRYRIEVGERDMLWASGSGWCESSRCYAACLEDHVDLDLFLSQPRATLEVVASAPDGAPVVGAWIHVDPEVTIEQRVTPRGTLEFLAPPLPVPTDERGRARLEIPAKDSGLPAEAQAVTLVVVSPGLPAWSEVVWLEERQNTLSIRLTEGITVRGICHDDGGGLAWKAHVEVLQFGGLARRETLTEADGTFKVDGLSPGEFVVRVLEDPRSGTRSARDAGSLSLESLVEGSPVDLAPLVLTSGPTVHGRVLVHGAPVADALVSFQPMLTHAAEGTSGRTTRSDDQGGFAFAGCDLQGGFVLSATPAGQDRPTVSEIVLRPDLELRPYDLELDAGELAPAVIEFLGSLERWPRRIELRRSSPSESILLDLEEGSSSFRSGPIPGGKYIVVAWLPGVGPWKAGDFVHVPSAPLVNAFHLPTPVTLELELDLAKGESREGVEAFVNVLGFDRFGAGRFGAPYGLREIPWSEERHAYAVEVMPGPCRLFVRGRNMAPIREDVEIQAGEPNRVRLEPVPGIRTRLAFTSRPMSPSEVLRLEASHPSGKTWVNIPAELQRKTELGFEVTAFLPLRTTELEAVTEQRALYDGRVGTTVLEGTRTIASGELDGSEGMPLLEFPLVERPR